MSKHPAASPLPNPLGETSSHSTRLQEPAAKSLVIPQAGEGANEARRAATPIFDEARHALGMEEMDKTHREFIAQVAVLIAAGNAEFPALFLELVNHTREHFIAEGQLMRASNYRGLPEHESEHHRVLGELQQLNRSLKRGRLPLVRAYVREGLPEWFDTHLAMMDGALAMHLKKQRE
jgi:hemerythrin-like metal-binding protein